MQPATKITAGPEDAGKRLDAWLAERLPDCSRARVQALIKAGCVGREGGAARPRTPVSPGMTVSVAIPPPEPCALRPEPIPLDVLHEDRDVVVVNKPPGLVVHPAAGHASGTLVNALLHHCGDLAGVGGELRPGIVQRLDKDTSGVMVVAKNDRAMEALVGQFKAGLVGKRYLAILRGVPRPAAGTVETLIGRSPHDRKKMSARVRSGRRAVTHYEVAEALGGFCLARVRIETGRTHQVRVHMAHLGYSVLGDRQYGRQRTGEQLVSAPRQMLHAHRLSFRHPGSDRPVSFTAPLAPDMAAVLEALRERAPP